jgi:hypothetical protein
MALEVGVLVLIPVLWGVAFFALEVNRILGLVLLGVVLAGTYALALLAWPAARRHVPLHPELAWQLGVIGSTMAVLLTPPSAFAVVESFYRTGLLRVLVN